MEPYLQIKSLVQAQWAGAPVAWPNEPFAPPDPPSPWIRVEFTGGSWEQGELGSDPRADNFWREQGLAWFHVFVPFGSGEEVARGTARLILDLFRGLDLGGLHFQDGAIGQGEPGDGSGNWWRVSAHIEWQNDS